MTDSLLLSRTRQPVNPGIDTVRNPNHVAAIPLHHHHRPLGDNESACLFLASLSDTLHTPDNQGSVHNKMNPEEEERFR